MHPNDRKASELQLCNNFRQLLFALADMVHRKVVGIIVYLEDDAPLSQQMKERLRDFDPQIEVLFTTDRKEEQNFSNLPFWFPTIIRRNLRICSNFKPMRSTSYPLPLLKGMKFKTGYFYHSGFFSAKSASASCERVILREAGLNNYLSRPVSFLKGIIRLSVGLSPLRQILGEEKWINEIEVAFPEKLPEPARKKGKRKTFASVMNALDSVSAPKLVAIFFSDPPKLTFGTTPQALLLTQPLDLVGLCTLEEKGALYQTIVQSLLAEGFDVHHKHHPIDTEFELLGSQSIQTDFPIELWPILNLPRFSVAVALCSASISETDSLFADKTVQLVAPDEFDRDHFGLWETKLPNRLRKTFRS